MRIDGAVSLCERSKFTYPGLLHRDYTADDLSAILARNRFDGAVAYACSGEPVAETDWLLSLPENCLLAVIAPAAGTGPGEWDRWRANPRFAGVAAPPVAMAQELAARDLVCVTTPAHAVPLADAAPNLRMIVRAWPLGEGVSPEAWVRSVAPLHPLPRMLIQMDGILDAVAARPALRYLVESFGPGRLAFGSNWPASMPEHTWKETLAGFTQALGAQPLPDRLRIVGESLQEFLRLPGEPHPLY